MLVDNPEILVNVSQTQARYSEVQQGRRERILIRIARSSRKDEHLYTSRESQHDLPTIDKCVDRVKISTFCFLCRQRLQASKRCLFEGTPSGADMLMLSEMSEHCCC